MNPQLTYILAQQRIADLQRAAKHARLVTDAATRRRDSRDSNPVTRLSAQLARLAARLAPTRLREANDAARTPLAHNPVVDSTRPKPHAPMFSEPMATTSVQASWAEATDVLVLADGTRLQLRPLGSDDRDGVAALFARLSPESRYRRFLSPKRELTPREVKFLTDIDHIHHEAFGATDERDSSIVGVGRYVHVADRPKVADLAVEVTDELQNMGIGTALARRTVQRARDNGFALLTATTLSENRPARALLRRLEFRAHARHGSEIELELKLDPPSDWPESTDSSPVVRALPMPTAHPSPEAWPAASLPGGTSQASAPTRGRPALCRTTTEQELSTAARMKAAWVPLTRDQESTPASGAPGNVCVPRWSLGTGMS
jgi:RimJ/RimL family protein N-acetyltransferase